MPWTELLTLEELPFSDSSGINVGTKVLAPWYCDAELTVRHAEAVVEGRGKVLHQVSCSSASYSYCA